MASVSKAWGALAARVFTQPLGKESYLTMPRFAEACRTGKFTVFIHLIISLPNRKNTGNRLSKRPATAIVDSTSSHQ